MKNCPILARYIGILNWNSFFFSYSISHFLRGFHEGCLDFFLLKYGLYLRDTSCRGLLNIKFDR